MWLANWDYRYSVIPMITSTQRLLFLYNITAKRKTQRPHVQNQDETMTQKHKEHSSEYFSEAREFWWNEDYLDILALRLKLNECHSLLDVGCGKGYMAFKLARYLARGASVFGIDAESRWVDEAEKKSKEVNNNEIRYKFTQANAYHLPFADNSVDISLCQTLLIHLAEPEMAVAEMVRVTKSNGYVVAFEPNNLVNTLLMNGISETSNSVEQILQKVEAYLRMERGKMALGEGFNSLGDVVPELFYRSGLTNIQVWLVDKAGSMIPPYNSPEYKARRNELLGWIDSNQAIYDYDENLKHYLAGGGTKDNFDLFWQAQETEKLHLADALKKEKYISAGGQMFYVVAGIKTA